MKKLLIALLISSPAYATTTEHTATVELIDQDNILSVSCIEYEDRFDCVDSNGTKFVVETYPEDNYERDEE